MYGFDSSNPRHQFGFVVLNFSPLGIPLILGTPLVLAADLLSNQLRANAAKSVVDK